MECKSCGPVTFLTWLRSNISLYTFRFLNSSRSALFYTSSHLTTHPHKEKKTMFARASRWPRHFDITKDQQSFRFLKRSAWQARPVMHNKSHIKPSQALKWPQRKRITRLLTRWDMWWTRERLPFRDPSLDGCLTNFCSREPTGQSKH